MKEQEKIYTLHAENSEWTGKLKFYKDEIEILNGRLAEIASKNNHNDVLKSVEHFQNQFIIQKNNIDEISHTVKMDEEKLIGEIQKNPVAVDHKKMPDHTRERELVESFEKNFNEIRSEFKLFAAKWM